MWNEVFDKQKKLFRGLSKRKAFLFSFACINHAFQIRLPSFRKNIRRSHVHKVRSILTQLAAHELSPDLSEDWKPRIDELYGIMPNEDTYVIEGWSCVLTSLIAILHLLTTRQVRVIRREVLEAAFQAYQVIAQEELTEAVFNQMMPLCGHEIIKAERASNACVRETEYQLSCLLDITGMASITLQPNWLTPTVKQLAALIYEERQWDKMPLLGDAMEEAGCWIDEVLSHCRSGGEHVRGCWVVDKVLGKE